MINIALGDDELSLVDLVGGLNRLKGLKVQVIGTNAEEFLLKVEQCQPEIVILDFMNPIDKGLNLIQKILTKYTPSILVISSIPDDGFVIRLKEIGVAYYLMKPFTIAQLAKRIEYVYEYHGNKFNPLNIHDQRTIQQFLMDYFADLGIPPYLKGHRYLLDSIMLARQDDSWLSGITKRLYPAVAKNNQTCAEHVERTIRYAIDMAWSKGDYQKLQQLFPYNIDPDRGKPTNSAFIVKMVDIINLHF